MINVLVKKLPAKVGYDWAEHKQKEKVGTMASEDKFWELMEVLKPKKEVTKDVLHKQELSGDKSKTYSCYVTGQTITIQQQHNLQGNQEPTRCQTLDCRLLEIGKLWGCRICEGQGRITALQIGNKLKQCYETKQNHVTS